MPDDTLLKEIKRTIQADVNGISPDFLEKNKDLIKQINVSVSRIAQQHGYTESSVRGSNALYDLSGVVKRTLGKLNGEINLPDSRTKSGIRPISMIDQNANEAESEIIQKYSSMLTSVFACIPEYENVVKLIPELQRVIDIISRDILNPNEFTKRALMNLYDDPFLKDEDTKKLINDFITEEIIDKYRLEDKLQSWIPDALVLGAKPVAVIPYVDVVQQAKNISSDINLTASGESYELSLTERLKGTIVDRSYENHFSFEDERSSEALETILDDETVDDYFDHCMENLHDSVKSVYREVNLFGTESEDNSDIFTKYEDFTKKVTDGSDIDARRVKIRDKLKGIVSYFDQNIEIVKSDKALFIEAYRKLKRKSRYDALAPSMVDIPKEKMIGLRDENPAVTTFAESDEDPENQGAASGDRTNTEGKSKSTFLKDALIVEYEPEFVIPVIVSGEHIGYYVVETDGFSGSEWRTRRRSSSFTDLVKNIGIGNDQTTVGGLSAVLGTSVQDPIDSSVFSPSNAFNGILNTNNEASLQNERHSEILKRIILKTIARRMNDPELVDNKEFRDAVMQLIRSDYIVKKRIQFTYIPAENMVYFNHKLDSSGLPVSILDGTLLTAYMYIASTVASLMIKLMKSADKEKMVVNVGLSGQLGMTISEIARNFSTRQIYTQSMFDNVGTVLKNTSVYQRMTIPSVNGEQLYDVEPLERAGDISIDDEYTQNRLSSILSKIGVPPSILNLLNDAEFSRSITMHNMEYRNGIVAKQSRTERSITKLLRLLVKYSSIDDKLKQRLSSTENKTDSFKGIDPSKIVVHLNPPTYLNMTTINEQISTADTMVEGVAKVIVEEGDNDLSKEVYRLYKQELYKRSINTVDWADLESLKEKFTEQARTNLLDRKKQNRISQKIMEEGEGEDAGGGFGDNSGSGSGDEGGGDSGGGDDSGGFNAF